MKPFSIFTGFSSSWLGSLASCCVPSSPRQSRQAEKNLPVWSDDAGYTPPASYAHPSNPSNPSRPEDSWPAHQRMQWPGAEQARSTATATAYAFAASGPSAPPGPPGPSGRAAESHARSLSHSRSRHSQSLRRRLLRGHGMSASLPIFSLSSPVRRLKISPPTNFRHLHSDSYVFPPTRQPEQIWPGPQARPPSFQLLELNLVSPSISSPGSSPVDGAEPVRPLRAHVRHNSTGSSPVVNHERSYSSMSFHVPRRQLPNAEDAASASSLPPPAVPPRSRMRSFSSPAVESMVERIASAMIEMEILQADIDNVMERQSIYVNSRPTTANGFVYDSLPAMPALPPAAPSFAERLSTERLSTERPQTAPTPHNASDTNNNNNLLVPASGPQSETASVRTLTPAPLALPVRNTSLPQAAQAAQAALPPRADTPLSPPLPLVLRPPLRKKKSFSQVSRWLFAGDSSRQPEDVRPPQKHNREISLDSVTNLPRPVTTRDGYYQCVVPPSLGDAGDRTSVDTVSTVETLSTWTTEREQNERRRVEQEGEELAEEEEEEEEDEVTWSRDSSPATATRPAIPTAMAMLDGISHRPQSVGVAF